MVPVGEIGEMKIFFHGTETEPEIQKMALKEKNFQTLESEQDPKEAEASMVSSSRLFSQEQVSPIQNEWLMLRVLGIRHSSWLVAGLD